MIPCSETRNFSSVCGRTAFASLKSIKVELTTLEEFFSVCAVTEQMVSQHNVQSRVFQLFFLHLCGGGIILEISRTSGYAIGN